MWIGVVSDTHGDLARTRLAVEQLARYSLAAVLHCGDIVGTGIIGLFQAWPTHFVFGNCDADKAAMRRTMQEWGQTCHEDFGRLTLHGREIAFLHGHHVAEWETAIQSGAYDLVCSGHTHRYEQRRVGKTLVLNPGAVHRASPHSVAVVNLETMDVEQLLLDPS